MEVDNIRKKSINTDEKKKKKKKSSVERKPRKEAESINSAVPLIEDATSNTNANNATTSNDDSKIRVSMFDYSVENHLREMSLIYKLCGEDEHEGLVDVEIERFASNITFLSEWRYFNYNPRTIHFVSEIGSPNENEAHNEITLSQFSAAMVPKCDSEAEKESNTLLFTDSRKDFVLYVGGLVWSLDWCPRIDQESDSSAQCEFIAVAAHPPDSSYHKQGSVLSGRGMIQIWCLLSCITKEDMQAPVGSTKRRYKTNKTAKKEENKPVRPRGRPRKNATVKAPVADPEEQITQALVVHLPEKTLEVPDDESMLSIQAPHYISTPVCELDNHEYNTEKEVVEDVVGKEKHQKDATKQKKPRGKARKYALDKTLVEDPEGEFISAHAVRFPEDTLTVPPRDKIVSSDPAPKKGKERKRKVGQDGKITMDETASISNFDGPSYQALAIEFPENIKNISSTEDHLLNTSGMFGETGKRRTSERVLATDLDCTLAVLKRRSRNKSKACNNLDAENSGLPTHDEGEEPFRASVEDDYLQKDDRVSEDNAAGNNLSDCGSDGCHMLKKGVLPRVVLCLGHDGKVAWDVKWRPHNAVEVSNRHRMGYLAVVLGNGSVEVWEVPSTQVINCIYASRRAKGTDPRFAKLKPVFRCSLLKYGDRQSMPLIVEWSASPPHDFLLAGCHDGVVALWKFSVDVPVEDTRPLLCFSAETGPIRSLSWAPYEGDPESSNIIVTAGHGGLKFWDLRDPFRPLWDANPSQRFLYGLDWVPDPRCVLVTYDDGTLRMLSLSRAAYDVPVTGQAFSGTQQQGLHSYHCSSFAVWSIHVSRRTGMVAYCCSDGTVLYFQLTHKAVDKDPLRNRAPHFLCGSLADEETAITMNTQLPRSPHRMKKSATEWANTPRPARTVASGLNQSKRTRKGTEKSQKPDDQILELSYDADTGNGDPNETPISAKGGKGKTSNSKKTNNDQVLICTVEDGDGENMIGNPELKEEAGKTLEVFPPKIVSMYRVRWNMNKGSERWLCYGGAAGIVRCQEIVTPEFDKKSIRR